MPPLIKSTPPMVDCKQGKTADLAAAPRSTEWITCAPALNKQEECTLSEKAALWIVEALTLLQAERKIRGGEHACLDEHEKAGIIRQ